jgi:hypothetical protein
MGWPLPFADGSACRDGSVPHSSKRCAVLPVFVVHPKAVALFVNAIPASMPPTRSIGKACLLPYAMWSARIALVFIRLGSRQRSRIGSVIASPA